MCYAAEMTPAQVFLAPREDAYLPNNRRWQGIASMERTPGGRLWCVFYSGGQTEENGNFVVVITSNDNGTTWLDPAVIVRHPDTGMRLFDPNVWADPQRPFMDHMGAVAQLL